MYRTASRCLDTFILTATLPHHQRLRNVPPFHLWSSSSSSGVSLGGHSCLHKLMPLGTIPCTLPRRVEAKIVLLEVELNRSKPDWSTRWASPILRWCQLTATLRSLSHFSITHSSKSDRYRIGQFSSELTFQTFNVHLHWQKMWIIVLYCVGKINCLLTESLLDSQSAINTFLPITVQLLQHYQI